MFTDIWTHILKDDKVVKRQMDKQTPKPESYLKKYSTDKD